uniref:Dipeptidyl peptidase 3 n=1 Tax=Syphacia muris TaxID=451379 RepID=A0A0N5AXJ5_9BILA
MDQYKTFFRAQKSSSNARTTMDKDKDLYSYPSNTPVCALNCERAFAGLTSKEKFYAHYMLKASFTGSLITYCQTSPESPALFVILYNLFKAELDANNSLELLQKKALDDFKWTDEEYKSFLAFAAAFFANSGNYKSFGDTKIVPRMDEEKFHKFIKSSLAAKKCNRFLEVYSGIEKRIFDLSPKYRNLELPNKGVTCYYSSNVTKEDTDFVGRYCQTKKLEGWNTRLVKEEDGNKVTYRLRLASIDCEEKEVSKEVFEGRTIIIERCDYGPLLKLTNDSLRKALEYVANENETKMITNYIKHFETGKLEYHKDASRFWIKDVQPIIESYIGFIENYRDPVGIRSEFEGFVAAVDKETSKKLQLLVSNAEEILKRLPWEKGYEKDVFLKPDFTALDVIGFGGSGVPAGINIPNYDEIRQDEGFKNVSLGNVIGALPKQKINFLDAEDEALFKKYHKESFEVQVGLHELLGHGSGKLLQRMSDGTYNFDRNLKDMITGKPVSSWYEPGETWSTKFGALSSAYEECRAEAVGYFLCTYPDIMKIFGYEGELGDTVKYVNWMSEIRAGLVALEFYAPDVKKWGQAHCFARFTLLRVCLEAGNDFVKITETVGSDGKPDLLFKLDKNKIDSVGKPAVGAFLKKLQAYKSTGNFVEGSQFFNGIGSVTDEHLRWREILINRRQPRRLLVQHNTELKDGKVDLKLYPETLEGIVQSVCDRFTAEDVKSLLAVWERDRHLFDL